MDLWELIEANKRGRSIRELMQDSGGHITDRSYFISSSIKKKRAFPAREKILGLATALEVSPLEVVLAAAESLGLTDGATSLVPAGDGTALLGTQARADRLQDALETERDLVRDLSARLSRLQSRAKEKQRASRRTEAESEAVAQLKERVAELQDNLEQLQIARAAGPRADPLPAGSEAEFWREHALRYRQRLARYEGLRPLPRQSKATFRSPETNLPINQ